MALDVLGVRVLRRALTAAVVVNYQIAREAHQPVLEVSLLRVVLFERAVDADENFLRQILGGVGA